MHCARSSLEMTKEKNHLQICMQVRIFITTDQKWKGFCMGWCVGLRNPDNAFLYKHEFPGSLQWWNKQLSLKKYLVSYSTSVLVYEPQLCPPTLNSNTLYFEQHFCRNIVHNTRCYFQSSVGEAVIH